MVLMLINSRWILSVILLPRPRSKRKGYWRGLNESSMNRPKPTVNQL